MKKVVKICCAVIILICTCKLVNAERLTCDNFVNSSSNINDATLIKFYADDDFIYVFNYNSRPNELYLYLSYKTDPKSYYSLGYSAYIFSAVGADDSKYVSYCRNPGLPTGKDGKVYYCVNNDQLNLHNCDNKDSCIRDIYNAGIIEILKNGYNKQNPTYQKWDPNNSSYIRTDKNHAIDSVATEISLRIYEMLWKNLSTSIEPKDDSGKTMWNINRFFVNQALSDNEITQKIASLNQITNDELIDEALGTTIADGYFVWHKAWNDTEKVDLKAKILALLKIGLDGAIEFADNGVAEFTYSDPSEQPVYTQSNDGNKVYKKEITYNFKAKNFKSNEAYIKMNFECENCKKYDADYNIFINDKNVGKDIPNNFVSYLTNGNGDIKFKIVFETSSSSYNCDNIDYKLDIDYYDETINTEIFTLYSSSKDCQSGGCQYFYLLYDYGTDVYEEIPIKNSINFCDDNSTCQKLENDCNNGDSEACDLFETKYNSVCLPNENSTCQSLESKCNKGDKSACDLFKNKYNSVCAPDENSTCQDLESECKKGNNTACKLWKDKFDSTCVNCGTSIQNAVCSDKDADINFTEGTEYDEKTCTNGSVEHILQCIVDNEDEAGNSYQATEIVSNNYCTVWCKEDFHLKLPGNQYTNSGRYFTLQASITGTKTCYTSAINKDRFKEDYTLANQEVNSAYKKYQNGTGTESQLNKEITDLETIINEYNSCSNWNMNYQFEPEVEFWYEETYMKDAIYKTLTANGTVDKKAADTLRCTSDTNDTYTSCDSDWTKDNKTENLRLYTCYKENGAYKCGYKNFEISNTVRMKSAITATGKYITPTQFYNIYPSGSIVSSSANNVENATPLTNALPVGLGTKKGVYNYTLKVNNLGEYYDSDNLGRVWGDEDSVISVTLEEQGKNSQCSTGALVDKIQINDKTFTNGVYTCGYVVNCPDCPVVCEPTCSPNCPPGGCLLVCDSCIFDNENINISYRPITSDDVNPSDREDLGANWQVDGEVDTTLEMKAAVTTKEIEETGENIYDINYTSSEKEFSMEVTLDSKMINWIRNYNDSKEDEGGYLNNSLVCYDHINRLDGETYKNIYCYSEFIDELITEFDNDDKEPIKFSINRPLKENERINYDNSNNFEEYWTTWSLAEIKNSWEINTTIALEATQKNYKSSGIGPAWK